MENVMHHYETACSQAVLFDLGAYTKVELAGPEARLFLHNLCTNDVKNLPEGGGCEVFLTTAKARVVGHGFVGHVRLEDQPVLLIDTVAGQADALVRHLNHYIVSEQVEIADRTGALAMHRVVGPFARTSLEAAFHLSLVELKHLQHQFVRIPGGPTGVVRRFDGLSLPAFDIIVLKASSSWMEKLDIILPIHKFTKFCASKRACRRSAAILTTAASSWRLAERRRLLATPRAVSWARNRL
jgi:hypothetical protein